VRLPTTTSARRTAAGTMITVGVLIGGLVAPAPSGAAPASAHWKVPKQHKSHPKVSAAHQMMVHKLRKLRTCESGDRYTINTGNGYYGAYQFAASTWHSLGYHGLPNHAKPTTQDRAATRLHAREGWHPWPACAKREHLYAART
jgi:hypothetical protein